MEFVTIDLGNYRAFLCPDGSALPGGMQITTCSIAECDPMAVTCVIDAIPQNQCNTTDEPLPKTLTTPIKYQSPIIYAVEYACEAGMVWLSGHIGSHFSTCMDGRWTPINDICSNIEEILPSDCSEIYSLGIYETAWYHIFPLGQLKGATKAFCKLDADNPGDNGWTTILFYAEADAIVDYTMLEDFDTGSIFNSYLNEIEKPYFIGIENLHFLTRNSSGERPLVIQVLGFNKMGFYHATYDEFLVDEVDEGYTLTSVGNYHGNTGDGFRLNVNGIYAGGWTDTDFAWFKKPLNGKTFFVNTDMVIYGSLPTPGLTHLQIRVRPKEFDTAVACPLVVPMEYLEPWAKTVVNLPTSRAPGVVFNYTCNFLYKEGINGKNRTSSGAVECLDDVDGEPPHWNASVTLPCTFACPDGYDLRLGNDMEIATVCYKVSVEGHPLGFFGAARSCGKDGATLADNPDVAFLTEMGLMDADNEDEFYYTAHAQRGTAAEMTPTLDAKCVESCKPKTSTECVTVSGTGAYESKSCYLTQMKYICVLPGNCPVDYTYFKGMCLNESPSPNMMSAMLGCQESGGGLFVPESLDAISKVQEFLSTTGSIGDIKFFLGSNDVFGNWTQNGYYNPDDEVVEWLGEDPEDHWRLLQFNRDLEYIAVPYLMDPMAEEDRILEYHRVICVYPGPIGCLQDPPETLQNMEFEPKMNKGGEIDENEGSYQCNEGFYLDENYTKTEKPIECYSQLGGWNLVELPTCIPSKCLEPPPDPLVNMTYDFDMNSVRVYETGEEIEYTCDPNFVVTYTTKNPAQNISCHGIESGWREDELTPCLPSMCEEPPPLPLENMAYPHNENTTYVLGDQLDYSCDLGHFVNGDVNLTLQFIECNGMLYEWPLDELDPCLPIEVCLEGPPEGNYSISLDSLSRYYGDQVETLCYPAMQTLSGMTVQYFNCSYLDDEETYGFLPLNLEECNVCADEMIIANATTNWATQETWLIDELVDVTCEEGYEVDIHMSTYRRFCYLYGWSGTLPCYRVCAEDLPVVEDMDMTTPFDNRIGAQLTFECFDGLYMLTEKYLPSFATATNVTCNSDFEWVLQDEPLACVTLCTDKPTVENTTVVWDEMRLWMKKHVIEVTCTAHHVFAFGKTSKKVSCTEEGWETIVGCHEACTSQPPEGRSMTMEMTENAVGTILEYTCTDGLKVRLTETYPNVTDKSHVVCAPDFTWTVVGRPLICEELVENPPEVNISKAYLGFSEGPYYRGQNLTVYCEEGLLSPKAKNSSIITNTVNGWEMLDPEFGCYEVTFMPPYQMALGSTIKDQDNPPYVLNQILEVECNPRFISNTGRRSTSYTFNQNGWVASEPHFLCLPA